MNTMVIDSAAYAIQLRDQEAGDAMLCELTADWLPRLRDAHGRPASWC